MLPLAGCGGNARGGSVPGNTLTIYASAPLSGSDRAMGLDVVNGEKLALAQSGGTADKFAINFSLLDSVDPKKGHWTPPMVAANARKASEDKGTIAYLGEVEPSASAVSVIFLNEAQTLQVSPTDTFAGLTEPEKDAAGEPDKYYPAGERTFARVVPGDDQQARALLGWMAALGLHRVALVYDNALYGRGLTSELNTEAEGSGVTIVGKPLVAPAGDPAKIAPAVRKLQPDAVFYGGAPTDQPEGLWRELAAQLPRVQIFAPSGLATPAVAAAAGSAAPRLHFTTPSLPLRYYGAAGRRFAHEYKARYGVAPGPWAIYGYAAMSETIAAIRRAGPRAQQRQAVIDAFFHGRGADPALHGFAITPAGESTARAFAGYDVRGGRLVFDRLLQPKG
jgi:branched-chain amino acid transport system substrate-binding protein